MGNTNGPMFKGRPSPSLKRMQQMPPDQLHEHLERLRGEAGALERRLAALRQAEEGSGFVTPPAGRPRRVAMELKRLRGLLGVGERLRESFG